MARKSDYETIVQMAINKVTGFEQLYKEMERAINVTGKSKSTLTNYGRQLAHLSNSGVLVCQVPAPNCCPKASKSNPHIF